MGLFFKVEGQAPRKPGEVNPVVLTRVASEDYFKAMGIRFAHGRALEARDRQPNAGKVGIVNEAFARAFWPGVENPVGKRFGFNNDGVTDITVVGVTKDIKHYGLERPMRPGIYLPLTMPRTSNLAVAVQMAAGADAAAFGPTARSLVNEIDPELPIYQVQTMETALAQSLRPRAVYSWMLGVFAVLAIALAVGGTYGVTAYLVGQRTREIGIRMAIGARPPDILRAVLRTGAPAIIGGIIVGVTAAVFLAGQLGELLFGVSPRDPIVIGIVTAGLAAAALIANWFPARRAASTDPAGSLKA